MYIHTYVYFINVCVCMRYLSWLQGIYVLATNVRWVRLTSSNSCYRIERVRESFEQCGCYTRLLKLATSTLCLWSFLALVLSFLITDCCLSNALEISKLVHAIHTYSHKILCLMVLYLHGFCATLFQLICLWNHYWLALHTLDWRTHWWA